MERIWRGLLALYPAAYRREFGEEIEEVLAERAREARRAGLVAGSWMYATEFAGLVRGAVREQIRAMAGLQPWEEFSMKKPTMRAEFRFPKATVGLMTLILAAVVMAIAKAMAIVASVPHTSPKVGPIQPEHYTVVGTFGVVFLMASGAAAIGWAILFALRRSGTQRLEGLK